MRTPSHFRCQPVNAVGRGRSHPRRAAPPGRVNVGGGPPVPDGYYRYSVVVVPTPAWVLELNVPHEVGPRRPGFFRSASANASISVSRGLRNQNRWPYNGWPFSVSGMPRNTCPPGTPDRPGPHPYAAKTSGARTGFAACHADRSKPITIATAASIRAGYPDAPS